MLKLYATVTVHGALATLPYWRRDDVRFPSVADIGPIDVRVERLRSNANDQLADLLAGYVDHLFNLMGFGFDNGLYGSANPVKPKTIAARVAKVAAYLKWIFNEGHETLQTASRSVFDEYLTEKSLHPTEAYEISQFYDWVRKKHRFVPVVAFSLRGQGVRRARNDFSVLNLKESQQAFARICAHPDARGRALALLALLYAQQTEDSIQLKREDLHRDEASGLWVIYRADDHPIVIESELSDALHECLALADTHTRRSGVKEMRYVFPGKTLGHISSSHAQRLIWDAAELPPNLLRRSAIVNMYRGGQKTMGTVVLRDVLGVSSPTIHRAIGLTGASINSPTAIDEAEAMRRAFLEDDD